MDCSQWNEGRWNGLGQRSSGTEEPRRSGEDFHLLTYGRQAGLSLMREREGVGEKEEAGQAPGMAAQSGIVAVSCTAGSLGGS